MSPWRPAARWGALRAAALAALAMAQCAAPAPAQGQSGGQTITAIVAAGSVGNSLTILITNANSWSELGAVHIGLRERARYLANLAIEPRSTVALAPNATQEIAVTFDVVPEVPADGATETVLFDIAADGILDQSVLTLRLGIETAAKPLHIVPFVVGRPSAEAAALLRRQGFAATVDVAPPPPTPDLFGTVAAQSVAAGEIVPAGTTVALTAYPESGVRVPEVSGLLIEEATRAVSAAGLTAAVTPLGDAPTADLANRVDRADPSSGTMVEQGHPIALLTYGPFRAAPPAGERGGPPGVRTGWGQPWRGELKLALIVADGRTISLLEAFRRYWTESEAAREEARREEERRRQTSGGTGGLLAAPGEAAGAIAGGIADGIGGFGEAITLMIAGVAGELEAGAPLSFTLVEEQGGFRLRIPGSTPLVDSLNDVVAKLPLLLPQGGDLLHAELTIAGAEGKGSVRVDLKAAPDWSELTVTASINGSDMTAKNAPRSIELRLTGVARQGLYEAAAYESDVLGGFNQAMGTYAGLLGIKLPSPR